jgi:hypothetical protein
VAGYAAANASLDAPSGVAYLLRELTNARADEAVSALLARDPAVQADVDHLRGVTELLAALRAAEAADAAAILAARAANSDMFSFFLEFNPAERAKFKYGREPDGVPSPPWNWPGD